MGVISQKKALTFLKSFKVSRRRLVAVAYEERWPIADLDIAILLGTVKGSESV